MHTEPTRVPTAGQRSTFSQRIYALNQFTSSLLITGLLFLPEVLLAVVQQVMQGVGRTTALPTAAFVLSSCVVLLDAVTDFLVASVWTVEGQLQGCSKAAAGTFTLAGHLAIFFVFAHFALAFSLALPVMVSHSYEPTSANKWLGRGFCTAAVCALFAAFLAGNITSSQAGSVHNWHCEDTMWPVEWAAATVLVVGILLVALLDELAWDLCKAILHPLLYLAKVPGKLWGDKFSSNAASLTVFAWAIIPAALLYGVAYTATFFCLWLLYSASLAIGLGSGENTFEILKLRGGLNDEGLGQPSGVPSRQEARFNRLVGACYALGSGPMLGLQIWMLAVYQQRGIPVPAFQWLSLGFSIMVSSGFVLGVVASGKSPATLWGEILEGVMEMCCCCCCRRGDRESITFSGLPKAPLSSGSKGPTSPGTPSSPREMSIPASFMVELDRDVPSPQQRGRDAAR